MPGAQGDRPEWGFSETFRNLVSQPNQCDTIPIFSARGSEINAWTTSAPGICQLTKLSKQRFEREWVCHGASLETHVMLYDLKRHPPEVVAVGQDVPMHRSSNSRAK